MPKLDTEYDSDYGTIISESKESNHRFSITIPPNTTGYGDAAEGKSETIGSGTHTYSVDDLP